MSGNLYLRLKPYEKRAGALALRHTVGGKLFVSGKWYSLPEKEAKRLKAKKQSSGADMFQVFTEQEFLETARAESAAIMQAAGLQGLALHGAEFLRPPSAKDLSVDKTKQVSMFKGLDKLVKDIDPSKNLPADTVDEDEDGEDEWADDSDTERAPAAMPDFTEMNRKDLVSMAKELKVEVPPHTRNEALIDLLKASFDSKSSE